MKTKPQNPIIKRDSYIGWEVFVPESLLPVELRTVSLSPEGIYIEGKDDSYDLIPFQELVELLKEPAYSMRMTIELEILSRNQGLLATLGNRVNIAAGQPEPALTGQQRTLRRWEAAMATVGYLRAPVSLEVLP